MNIEPSKQLLHGVFVTALEGGIGYWFRSGSYRWSLDGGVTVDLETFRATGREIGRREPLVIEQDTIYKGIQRIIGGEVQVNDYHRTTILKAVVNDDAGYIDADDADCIVQAGLLNDIVYG